MSDMSERVKRWRRRSKEWIVSSFGGKCGLCGYDRCIAAMDFHHLDPLVKDFSMAALRVSPRRWAVVVEELRKCVMLCSRCHREVHAGIHPDLSACPRFDETFANRPVFGYVEKTAVKCAQCGSSCKSKFCSPKCFNLSTRKVDWDKVDFDLLLREEKSVLGAARKLGVTDNALRKAAALRGVAVKRIRS